MTNPEQAMQTRHEHEGGCPPGHGTEVPVTPAAGIAGVVGTVLAQVAEATGPHQAEDAAEIRAITEAMVRLLVGVPLRSDGQLTAKSLAEEAGLKRNKLTHKHTGLKDLFYALVRAQDSRPKAADGLQRENEALKQQLTQVRRKRDLLNEQVKQFARVVHVLEVENQQLREATMKVGTVHVLPGHRGGPLLPGSASAQGDGPR